MYHCLCVRWLQGACARSVTSAERRRWCANTGSEACARRGTSASFSTNTTWPRCPSATSTPSLVRSLALRPHDRLSTRSVLKQNKLTYYVCVFSGECSNKECPFLHIDPESKIKDCPWYDRGFCKHGGSWTTAEKSSHKYGTLSSSSSALRLCLRSRLQTQTHETSHLCQLPGGLLSRRKILQIHAVCNHIIYSS